MEFAILVGFPEQTLTSGQNVFKFDCDFPPGKSFRHLSSSFASLIDTLEVSRNYP